MRGRTFLLTLAVIICLPRTGLSVLIFDPPRPITHRVTVQMIQTALDDGSSPATVFGNATQRAEIEGLVDKVWAQAGIDIQFLPNIVRYNDTFAYQGNLSPRPDSDLQAILNNAWQEGGILHPNSSVINMVFVNVVPHWDLRSENWAAGLSNVGTNGIAQFVGDNLLPTQSGRENVAHWVSHEIAHNLGLFHAEDGSQNLMTTSRTNSTSQLSQQQISAIFQTQARYDSIAYIPAGGTGFPKPLTGPLDGDYNRNGMVDASDYTRWRDTLGSTSNLTADGNGDGVVNLADLAVWKTHFGYVAASGASSFAAVPEPATWVFVVTAFVMAAARRQTRQRRR